MSSLYLIRHAHAFWQPEAHEQSPLSAKGHKAAQRVAEIMGELPITAVYSSPARRAQQTIQPLAQRRQLPVLEQHGLSERRLSGIPVPDADFREAVRHSWAHPQDALPGGEPNQLAQQRGVRAIEQIRANHPGEHIAIATHGNLLALILQHYDASVDFAFWQGMTMPDIYQLDFAQGQPISRRRLWLPPDPH